MGFFATKKDIDEEVASYQKLTFFKKSKNILVVFIIVLVLITFYISGLTVSDMILVPEGSALIIAMAINLIFAFFIYLNHRWAMVAFCLLFVGDKIMFLLGGASPSQIIWAALAIMLTISSIRVASQLKKTKHYK